MSILVILAHPDRASLNHAIANTAVEELKSLGHDVVFHDLCAEGFDPLITSEEFPRDAEINNALRQHCDELAEADGIVIVHPNWWGQPPAILKGWVDRVVRPDVAYRFVDDDKGEGVPVGLLRAKSALVLNTSNTFPEREVRDFGDPLETIWKNCIFGLCGVKEFKRRTFGVVVTSTEQERRDWLDEVQQMVRAQFPISAPCEA